MLFIQYLLGVSEKKQLEDQIVTQKKLFSFRKAADELIKYKNSIINNKNNGNHVLYNKTFFNICLAAQPAHLLKMTKATRPTTTAARMEQ